jgi:hypothetical protein
VGRLERWCGGYVTEQHTMGADGNLSVVGIPLQADGFPGQHHPPGHKVFVSERKGLTPRAPLAGQLSVASVKPGRSIDRGHLCPVSCQYRIELRRLSHLSHCTPSYVSVRLIPRSPPLLRRVSLSSRLTEVSL